VLLTAFAMWNSPFESSSFFLDIVQQTWGKFWNLNLKFYHLCYLTNMGRVMYPPSLRKTLFKFKIQSKNKLKCSTRWLLDFLMFSTQLATFISLTGPDGCWYFNLNAKMAGKNNLVLHQWIILSLTKENYAIYCWYLCLSISHLFTSFLRSVLSMQCDVELVNKSSNLNTSNVLNISIYFCFGFWTWKAFFSWMNEWQFHFIE